jgi:hypothetical protein
MRLYLARLLCPKGYAIAPCPKGYVMAPYQPTSRMKRAASKAMSPAARLMLTGNLEGMEAS